jgi:hypothetical protein
VIPRFLLSSLLLHGVKIAGRRSIDRRQFDGLDI